MIRVMELEFQMAAQRMCASSSCLEEEDNDMASSIEPAMSTQNPTFSQFFSILAPFQTGFHEKFIVLETRHNQEFVEGNLK